MGTSDMRFHLTTLGYPKVSEHTEYLTLYPDLMGQSLKEMQRAWVCDFLCKNLPAKSKVLDLGGSACELADALSKSPKAFDVTVIDPYDGSGNGPSTPEPFKRKYPHINIVRGFLNEETNLSGYAAVISSSVIEHIPVTEHRSTVAGIKKVLAPHGYSVHAIDFTVRGVDGFLEQTADGISNFASEHGVSINIAEIRQQLLNDVDTYYLSPAMYQQWRGKRTFKQYPWRQVSSINFVAQLS